jgi:hypothetical protein
MERSADGHARASASIWNYATAPDQASCTGSARTLLPVA